MQEELAQIPIESIFIRHRNTLMLTGTFSDLYTDYYVHLMDNKLTHNKQEDQIIKRLIAVFCLHLTARPWAEKTAWTIHLPALERRFFIAGSSLQKQVIASITTQTYPIESKATLSTQTSVKTSTELRNSTVEIISQDPLNWLEIYYRQSEQRPARAFELKNEKFLLFTAQPDYDEEWLQALTTEQATNILEKEATKLLETRHFAFHCGCTSDILIKVLQRQMQVEDIFQDDEQLQAQCPRCQTYHIITKKDLQ